MMTTKQINVEQVCYISRKSFREVLKALDAGDGHPKMEEVWGRIFNASTATEVDETMRSTVGSSGLIEFLHFNHGDVVHKGRTGSARGNVRLMVENPSIMRRMAEHVPNAGSYAPVTILGARLRYDHGSKTISGSPVGSPTAIDRILSTCTRAKRVTGLS